MAYVTPEIMAVREQLVGEIRLANRTSVSLIRQGFSRSNVQLGLAALARDKRIFKYGSGKATYYSIYDIEPDDAGDMTDPIILPEGLADDFKLAFRMGYTNIAPKTGRIYKELLA